MIGGGSIEWKRLLSPAVVRLLVVLCFAGGLTAYGQAPATLRWGVEGAGGSGTWNTSAMNWWDGSQNVRWVDGGAAIFAGEGGIISGSFGRARSLTFNSPGYDLQGSGSVTPFGSSLRVTTNQDAAIQLWWFFDHSGATIIKDGPNALTMSGHFTSNVRVDAGEFITSTRQGGGFTLADAAEVKVTLDSDDWFHARNLFGGGPSGGIIQPSSRARTVTLSLPGIVTFGGVLQDNGEGKLGLQLGWLPNRTRTFTGVNTYTGPTDINGVGSGALYKGNGSSAHSPFTVQRSSFVRLDNSEGVVANRLSDSHDLTLNSGRFEFIGDASTPVEEKVGALKYSGAVTISNIQPGNAPAVLSFAGATRTGHGTIQFLGNGETRAAGLVNDASGILGSHATYENEWAIVAADGRISSLANYSTDFNSGTATDHVKIIGGGVIDLSASATRATLNLQNNTDVAGVLNLAEGSALTLNGGGIVSSGGGENEIRGGSLVAGSSEWIVTNRNALTISSNIGETEPGTGFKKSGAGMLTLTGANSFSGDLWIHEGVLEVSSDSAMGSGTEIVFDGGSLKAAQSFVSTKDLVSKGVEMTIDTAGHDVTLNGQIDGTLRKIGEASLTLPEVPERSISVLGGSLILPEVRTGDIYINRASLVVSGALERLNVNYSSVLDIGGTEAATLTVEEFISYQGAEFSTFRFGLGQDDSDLLRITSTVESVEIFSPGRTLFDFHDTGGAKAGVSYTLIEVTTSGFDLDASSFRFSPDAVAAGWAGTFHVSPTEVSVLLTATPEPNSLVLLAFGAAGIMGARRRRQSEPC